MASSSGWGARPIKPEDRDLICPICLDPLTIPRSLTCLHSFCTKCLSSHISKTETKVSRTHRFICPVCRTVIRPPFSDTPLTAWAEQFPIDVVLASMLPGDKSITDKTCEPCSVQGKQLKAEYFCVVCKECRCQTCYEHHKSSKLLKGHQIVTLEEFLSDPAMTVTIDDTLTCTNHGDKEYEFFCSDHGKVLCATCLEEGHKACTNCKEINVHAKEVIKEQKPDKVLNKMKELEKHLKDVSKKKRQTMLDFEANIKKVLNEISTLKQKINSVIDDLERRVSEERKKVSEWQSMRILEEDKNIQSVIAAVKNSCKQLEAISKYGSETQVCVVLHKMEKQLLAYQSKAMTCSEILKINIDINIPDCIRESSMVSVTDLSCNVLENLKILPLPYDITQFIANEKSTKHRHTRDNETDDKHIHRKDRDRDSGRESKGRDIVKVEEFQVHRPENAEAPAYIAVDCLPDDKIVFLDMANSRCCLYDSRNQYLSEYKLSSDPRRMCVFAKNEIAITLPEQSMIQFLLIGDTITSKRTISVTRCCTAIASLKSKNLVFAGYHQDSYHWGVLTKNGHEKSCFYIPRQNQSSNGTYLTLNSKRTRVYISCPGNNAVYCFDLDGIKHFEYTSENLNKPADMAIDNEENLFIVGYYSCNIHQLSQDGLVLKVITDGIPQCPMSICFKPSGKQLLLTNHDDVNLDTCYVYQLQLGTVPNNNGTKL
ncbi:hypothetical protein CHS0354_025866 [Potamilus streckersoni]|uniref:Uncharacterized protein n=1 Tax=Potamilus streckersoni TaxID=2493646 RepID=A0AAE0VSD7_9BIVA|nr:hypothetical protein CHS0354_025866 [Potamilus streckersoni]